MVIHVVKKICLSIYTTVHMLRLGLHTRAVCVGSLLSAKDKKLDRLNGTACRTAHVQFDLGMRSSHICFTVQCSCFRSAVIYFYVPPNSAASKGQLGALLYKAPSAVTQRWCETQRHVASKWRRTDVDATLSRIDVSTTSFRRHSLLGWCVECFIYARINKGRPWTLKIAGIRLSHQHF